MTTTLSPIDRLRLERFPAPVQSLLREALRLDYPVAITPRTVQVVGKVLRLLVVEIDGVEVARVPR